MAGGVKRDKNGNLSVHIGEFHIRKHEEFLVRARAMAAMRDQGCSEMDIARAHKTTRQNVQRILKQYQEQGE